MPPTSRRSGHVARALCALLVAWTLAGCAAPSAPPVSERAARAQHGVVILVSEFAHLPVSLKTSEQLLATHGADRATIVVCGKALSAVERDSAAAPLLEQALRRGVRVVACGLSMKKLGVRATDLAPGVATVPNGLIEVIRLQRRGFASIAI